MNLKPSIAGTEARVENARDVSAMERPDALRFMLDCHVASAEIVSGAIPPLEAAAHQIAACLAKGRKLAYVGAGSSGILAVADGLELPGTFGINRDQIALINAGGPDGFTNLTGVQDDLDPTPQLKAADLSRGDYAILVSASGTTPFTLKALSHLKSLGVNCIAIANNSGSELLVRADTAILLQTPPEAIAGSTRLGAGTSQKIALNMISSLVGVLLGHVYEGHMINVIADNEKLRQRACRMVSDIASCSSDEAKSYLDQSCGSVKIAIMLASGAGDAASAERALKACNGHIGPAMKILAEHASSKESTT